MADTTESNRDLQATGPVPDCAGLTAEPPSGGLPAVLGRLRDAAADHDDELPGPDRLLPPA